MRRLRAEHLRPIAEIALVILADAPDIRQKLRLPRFGLGPVKLLSEGGADAG